MTVGGAVGGVVGGVVGGATCNIDKVNYTAVVLNIFLGMQLPFNLLCGYMKWRHGTLDAKYNLIFR